MPVNTGDAVTNATAQGIDLGVSQAEYNRLSSRERAELRRRTPGTYAYERAGGAAAETRNLTSPAGGRGSVVEQPGARAAAQQTSGVAGGRGTIVEQQGARAAALADNSAADTFTVGYGEGQVDPRLAAAADRASDTPSPSTVQATNAAGTGATSPSLAGQQTRSFTTLSPRPYFRIDPLDNRYDFLTGQKVNTTGGQPNTNNPSSIPGGGNTTGGSNPDGTPASNSTVGYGEGQIDPRLAAAVADQTTDTPPTIDPNQTGPQ